MNIDLSTDAPPSPERTLQLAEALPDITRTLNHATMDHEALRVPAELDRLVRALEITAQRLPQLLVQSVRWAEAEHAEGRIGVAYGEWAGRPAAAVTALQVRRDLAIAAAESLCEALEAMAEVTCTLAVPETGEGGSVDTRPS